MTDPNDAFFVSGTPIEADKPEARDPADEGDVVGVDRIQTGYDRDVLVTPTPPNRGNETVWTENEPQPLSVKLKMIDTAIITHLRDKIRPTIIDDGKQIVVPVQYANAERWKQIRRDGVQRDGAGKILTPLIMLRRSGVRRAAQTSPVNKFLDRTYVTGWNRRNSYDKFALQNRMTPSRQLVSVKVPDYIDITYDFMMWTEYVDQMNDMIEQINYEADSYWGERGNFKFRVRIDDYRTDTDLPAEGDRVVKTTFQMMTHGYLLPETMYHQDRGTISTNQLRYSRKKILVFNEIDDGGGFSTTETLGQVDTTGSLAQTIGTGSVTPGVPVLALANNNANPSGAVDLSWSSIAGVDGYIVERSGSWVFLTSRTNSQLTYTDSTATESKNYSYRVAAVNGALTGTFSSSNIDTYPNSPSGLSASNATSSSLQIDWTNNSAGYTRLLLEASIDQSTWALSASLAAGATQTTLSGFPENTEVFVRAAATFGAVTSSYSAQVSASTATTGVALPDISTFPVSGYGLLYDPRIQTSSTIWSDRGTGSYELTLLGSPVASYSLSPPRLEFDDTNSNSAQNNSVPNTYIWSSDRKEATIFIVIKPEEIVDNSYVVDYNNNRYDVILGFVDNNFEFFSGGGTYSGDDPRTGTSIPATASQWQTICYTAGPDGANKQKGYSNGALAVGPLNKSWTWVDASGRVSIGSSFNFNANNITGSVGYVIYWPRELSAVEVQQVHDWIRDTGSFAGLLP